MPVGERADTREAWTAFWQGPVANLQCIRGAPDITQALRGHWASFAASLPPETRVLDLGCGAGAAARSLVAARRDLRVTGIDFARIPSPTDPHIHLLSGTAMESLPFADASFGAAVSQFGFEYGRIEETAEQLARVLAPGARVSFLVHHAESSIVASNRARLAALVALQEQKLRAAFLSGNAVAFTAEMASLRRRHPRDTLVAELARILPPRARLGGRERLSAWSAVERALSPEHRILEALDACCVAPESLEDWLQPLGRVCDLGEPAILRKPNGQPISWRIDGALRQLVESSSPALCGRANFLEEEEIGLPGPIAKLRAGQ